MICTFGYLDSPFIARCLTFFIEAHHHDRSTIAFHIHGVLDEHLFAFFQRDAVHDTLSLHTFQSTDYHVPV